MIQFDTYKMHFCTFLYMYIVHVHMYVQMYMYNVHVYMYICIVAMCIVYVQGKCGMIAV